MNALPSQGLVKRLAGHPAEAGSSGSERDASGVERAGWGRAAEGWELRRGRQPPSTTRAAGSPATAAARPVADVPAALGGGAVVDDDRDHQRAAARAGAEHLQPVQPVDQEAATPGPIGRPPRRQLAGPCSRAATLRDRADRAIGAAPPAATWGYRVFLVQPRHDAAELPPTGSAGRPPLAQQHDSVLGGVQPGSRPPWFGDGPVLRATSHPAGGSRLSRPRGPQRPGRDDRQAADTAVRVPPPRLRRGRGAPAADGQRRSWTPRCLRRRVARALLPDGGPLARLGLPVHRRAGAGRPPNDGAFQGWTGRRQTTQRPHRLGGQPPTRAWRVDRGCEPRHPSVRRAEHVDTPTLIPPSAGRLARFLLTRPAAPPRSLGPLASLAPSRYREAERRARSSSASSWVRVSA
jgi:hypothetical protein